MTYSLATVTKKICGIYLLQFAPLVFAFNLQDISKGIVFTNERRGTDFGYSVALHENENGKWLLVGAPKDYKGDLFTKSPEPKNGALYSCRLMERIDGSGKITKKGKCAQLDADGTTAGRGVLLFTDFESSNLTQVSDDDFDWEYHVGKTNSENTGPSHDHTIQKKLSGHYMLLESSHPRGVGQIAILATSVFPQTNAVCVRFWYHMRGATMGSLNLYVLTNTTGSRMIWSLENDQGDMWHEGWTTVISHEPYKILFEGVIGQGYNSDIGLDDITVLDGICAEDIKPMNESLGMKISRSRETGQVLACAPTWSYTCKGQNHGTGLCYLFSEDLATNTMQMLAPCRSPSCTEGKMDLIFLIDGSHSVNAGDFENMIRWLNNVVSSLPLGRYLTRVGVAQYTNRPRTEFNLNQYFKLEDLRKAIKAIKYMGGTTATGRGINYIAEQMFSKEAGMRPDAKHVAVVITDGKSQDDVVPPSKNAKAKGIIIFAIGVGVAVESELRNISSDPDDQFVYFVNTYEALDGIRGQLQKKLFSLESQGSAFTTEQCQAGLAANFVNDRPVIGLPGLHDWSGGFALYPGPDSESTVKVITTGFRDLVSQGEKGDVLPEDPQSSGDENDSEANSMRSRRTEIFTKKSSLMSSSSVSMSIKITGQMRYTNMTYSKSSQTNSFHVASETAISAGKNILLKPEGLMGNTQQRDGEILNQKLHKKLSAAALKSPNELISQMLAHSYFGYSIASGTYSQPFAVEIAVGGPRVLSVGSVFIVQLNEHEADDGVINEPVIMHELSGDQMGSYFGFSVCMTDMNADGLDELLVGAPLWMGKDEDMGQVTLYLSSYDVEGIIHPRQKIILRGSREPRARFGFSIAAAGDLNRDGFADIVIGAPSNADGDGAVYVYNGCRDVEKMSHPTQIIKASGTKKKLAYFGFSLHAGLDIDGNGYHDVACGAPGNSRAVVLFSRPVIQVKFTLAAAPSVINISSPTCAVSTQVLPGSRPGICSSVQACATVTGHRIPMIVGLKYKLQADADPPGINPRAYFRDTNPEGDLDVMIGRMTCFNAILIFKEPIRDLSTDLWISLNYSLSDKMTHTHKSPVLNKYDENPVRTKIAFDRECESKNCRSDLTVKCSANDLKTHVTSEALILDVDRIINIYVNLTNEAEDAYNTEMRVFYNEELFLSKLTSLQASRCMKIIHDEDDIPGHIKLATEERKKRELQKQTGTKTLQLMYKQPIMSRNAKCSMKLQFGINSSFTGGIISISVATSSANPDVAITDNFCKDTFPVYLSGEVAVIGHSADDQVRFDNHRSTDYISLFSEIGPVISHSYLISNLGLSTIPYSKVQLSWPSETKSRHDILYLTSMECIPAEKCHCKDLEVIVNPDQINTTNGMDVQVNRGEQNVHIKDSNNISTTNSSDEEYVEVRIACDDDDITCESMSCSIANLRPSDTVKVILNFRLWRHTFNQARIWKAVVATNAQYSSEQSQYIIVDPSRTEHEVTTAAYGATGHPVKDDFAPSSTLIWIIIVAIVAGILLLALAIFVLYRAGFFESKYKQKKDESLEWRDFGQCSSAHEDRVHQNTDALEEETQHRLSTFQRSQPTDSPST